MTKNKYLPEGSLLFTKENREYLASIGGLERAKNEGKILEAVAIKCDSSTLSIEVDLNGIKGIIYKNECLYGTEIKDIAIITRVGKSVAFKVMGFERDEKGKTIAILSRREAQRDCLNNYLLDLIPGDIIPAKITHFEPFGAFLDIGCGVSSLMSIDSVSVSRIESPRDRFDDHEEIKVIVKSIDYETGRIYVSTKELFGTWEENVESFSAGQTVSGIIRSIESYGIFVELAPNLAGLAELKDGVNVGDGCAVYIKSIIPDKMKIKLVIIDTYDKVVKESAKKYYYVDTDAISHVDRWIYSPKNSQRVIETIFDK